jgi:hypothetical protein
MTPEEHLSLLLETAKRNQQKTAELLARRHVRHDIPEQRAFEAARAEMYESRARLERAEALIRQPNLTFALRQEARAMLHAQKVATRLAVKAFFHAGKVRNDAEKELERGRRS